MSGDHSCAGPNSEPNAAPEPTTELQHRLENQKDRILDIIRSEAVLSDSPQIALFAGQVSQKIKEIT